MAQVVLGAVGGAVGGGLGRMLGGVAGGMLDRAFVSSLAPARQVGPRLEAIKLQGVSEGAPIPCALGRMRVTGQVIWAARFLERRHERGGGKGGPKTVEHDYSLSFAVGLVEGPIDGIGRIWADGQPLDQSGVAMRVYRGGPDQTPDPLIEAVEGRAPAYRGLAYVVFEDLPLAGFGNRPPQLSFEVFRRPRGAEARLEDRLEGVCLIPGAGEFALATEVVMRRESLTRTRAENLNNLEGRPDILVSLDQLAATYPNLKRVSLVVGWFGDDLRAGHCRVRPGVERVDKPTTPLDWGVAGLKRHQAHVISESDGGPAYGGTPDDESVRQAIRALKARGWAVTLYPFVFMDVPKGNGLPDPYGGAEQAAYPWRGRITGAGGAEATSEVAALFGDAGGWGLRRMVLHYAALARECGADGLLIGSEMRGVTTIRDAAGGYPAVEALRDLAGECRAIVGPAVSLSYAADWSEYFGHQPNDGSGDRMFHLDPLWADPTIDYVGVDWYPPMGDWRDGETHLDARAGYEDSADAAYLAAQVAGGEQYDWYYADDAGRLSQTRRPIYDGDYGEDWVFRPKDLKSWWSQRHHDRPGGVRRETPTAWTPGMKPIRLTEFGCAAVDKGANAPNLFQDPKSSESHRPPFSNGARDDRMQRRALEAVITHFAAPENNPVSDVYGGRMIAAMDAWCWDARPYPDFPGRTEVWADAANWNAGHWLNGRGLGEAADLIAAILKRGGLAESDFSISGVTGAVDGYLIDRPMRTRDALAPVVEGLDLTLSERGGRVSVSGDEGAAAALGEADVALGERGGALEAVRALETPPDTARVRFIDGAADYQTGAVVARAAETGGGETGLDLPMACGVGLARQAARRALMGGAALETIRLRVGPVASLTLEAGDRVALEGRGGRWRIDRVDLDETPRLTLTRLETAGALTIEEETPDWRPTPVPPPVTAPLARLLDLPPLLTRSEGGWLAAVAAEPWRPMAIHAGAEAGTLSERGVATTPATVGALIQPLAPGRAGLWDRTGALVVAWEGPAPVSVSPLGVLAGANMVAIETEAGWEVAQFAKAEALGGGAWRLSGLLRGQQGSERGARAGAGVGAMVVAINEALTPVETLASERSLPLMVRIGPAGAPPGGAAFTQIEAAWRGVYDRPWSPASLRVARRGAGAVIRWRARARLDGDRWDGEIAATDPMRFRIRVLDAAGTERRWWSAEGLESLYPATEMAADGAGPGWRIAVAQESLFHGWGDEATRPL